MKELEEALEQEREAHSRVSYTVTVYTMRVCMWAYAAVSIRHNRIVLRWQQSCGRKLLLLLLLQTVAEPTLADRVCGGQK